MTREEFLRQFEEILDLPGGQLGGGEKLEDLEQWNSFAMVTFIGLVDEHCGRTVSPRQFVNCSTVNDILQLAGYAQ